MQPEVGLGWMQIICLAVAILSSYFVCLFCLQVNTQHILARSAAPHTISVQFKISQAFQQHREGKFSDNELLLSALVGLSEALSTSSSALELEHMIWQRWSSVVDTIRWSISLGHIWQDFDVTYRCQDMLKPLDWDPHWGDYGQHLSGNGTHFWRHRDKEGPLKVKGHRLAVMLRDLQKWARRSPDCLWSSMSVEKTCKTCHCIIWRWDEYSAVFCKLDAEYWGQESRSAYTKSQDMAFISMECIILR